MLEVGKLYSCSKYFLMLYPDKKTAAAVLRAGDGGAALPAAAAFAAATASYWSKRLGKSVSYCNPKTPLLVLAVEEKYIEVLVGDKRGWIIYQDWCVIKEIVDAAA